MSNNKDDFIRKKMQEDNYIPENINKIFTDFQNSHSGSFSDTKIYSPIDINSEINDKLIENNSTKDNITYLKNSMESSNEKVDNKTSRVINTTSNILFYKKLNKFLSVAAVFLCVILVGSGAALYNKPDNIEQIDIVTSKTVVVKNKELQLNNEQILKYSENDMVKASIIGKRKVAIQLKSRFIERFNINLAEDKQYEVSNFNKDLKDIFVGYIISELHPYVMLLMEDNTVEYIPILKDPNIPTNNYELEFFSQGRISGLHDVVSFEQSMRYFDYSSDTFYFINAVRKDGMRKSIQIGYYNDWDDDEDILFNRLNSTYIQEYERENQKNSLNNTTQNSTVNNTVNTTENSNKN